MRNKGLSGGCAVGEGRRRSRGQALRFIPAGLLGLMVGCSPAPPQADDFAPVPNASGFSQTVTRSGQPLDRTNAFFQSLGSNGRSCSSCHQPDDAWTVTPAKLQARFDATGGTDPVFRLVDGANSPQADVTSVEARRKAYSMLLRKGLIRVGLPIPAGAEFTLTAVDDPYGFASAQELSLFRRILPSSNTNLLSTVMWDGRETFKGEALHFDLAHQANSATLGHAQAKDPLTTGQQDEIANFEKDLFSAQTFDQAVGSLTAAGAQGGPQALSAQEFYLGINDPLGLNPSGAAFDPRVFHLYDAWADLPDSADGVNQARRSVARGQAIFNTHPIEISGVGGLNDDLNQPLIQGTCTTCHDAPNVGHHSVPMPLNLGLADASRRTPDLPLYTLKNTMTGETVQTTDPGRALITGQWQDIGRFKGPILRNLAARAPYFHNGSAANLAEVVDFYNTRFDLKLSPQDEADLLAFLKTL